MKKINIIIPVIAILLWSCFDDKGNYDYTDNEVITISGIDKEYTRLYMKQRLTIQPEVTTSVPKGEFAYCWTLTDVGGDTVALTKDLDILVDKNPNKTHVFVFSATNKGTGLTAFQKITLIVNTPFSNGWYVLKDDGIHADIDLYAADNSRQNNLIQFVNGRQLKGKAEKFSFFGSHPVWNKEENKYIKTKTLFALTDQDVVGLDASQATIIRSYEEMFFSHPAEGKPVFMAEATDPYFIDNGKLYAISGSSASNGKFGVAKNLGQEYDYYLSKYTYYDYLADLIVFDTVRSSFFTGSGYLDVLSPLKDGVGTEMSCTANNKRLLYLGSKDVLYGTTGYAVMQDKTNPDLKMISKLKNLNNRSAGIVIENDILKPTDAAFRGKLFTLSYAEEAIYFIADGCLWMRNVAGKGGIEVKQFTIPVGEEATFIRSFNFTDRATVNLKHVALGTTDGTNYKVRFFLKTTAGNLKPEPDFTLPAEGDTAAGRVADVIYMSPKVGAMTYIHSY